MKSNRSGNRKERKIPEYIKLKEPADILSYCQRLVNRIRREGKELQEIGPITNLLNVALHAHKRQVEYSEIQQMKATLELLTREREDAVNVSLARLEENKA